MIRIYKSRIEYGGSKKREKQAWYQLWDILSSRNCDHICDLVIERLPRKMKISLETETVVIEYFAQTNFVTGNVWYDFKVKSTSKEFAETVLTILTVAL